MKQRKLNRYSKVLSRIHFHSKKNDSIRYCDSELEAERLLMLEFDKNVVAYNTQPHSFSYTVNKKVYRYTPDIIISHKQKGIYFEEVKPLSKLENDKNRNKFNLLKMLFWDGLGMVLETVTDEDIHHVYTIANYKKLYGFYGLKPTVKCQESLAELPKILSYSELVEFATKNNWHLCDAIILIANQFYTFELSLLLNPNTKLIKQNDSTTNI
ncbi:Tn7 transposase TnsA N-terminal domain-containing protein [Shewanella sp. 6_MG-2023]|uniref:Tn7 transposase TnsA N-terminal domain-containing protein n=1 Tax=Shewanella sp. 6_MG-2023 TaxID=3062660 RepID=UPI0026E41BC4|nr:Tn7 transposase TnsA N-terminal domain-containing protein [Shewanella sp. 6_MG-2023]MDO6620148.1 Tn7 transposase TnsA N-terminal domain-containing protein [Shewanella sp. 6_MG-2023]